MNNEWREWEEALIVEVMEEYVETIEGTHGMEYGERVTRRRACFDKLKSFIQNLLSTQEAQVREIVEKLRVTDVRVTFGDLNQPPAYFQGYNAALSDVLEALTKK